MTVNVSNWRQSATVGDMLVYFRGNLAMSLRDPEVRVIAADAWALNLAGKVTLTQRRITDHVFAYRATAANLRPWVERKRV